MTPTGNGHGNRCSCRMLAEAMGCEAATISYQYCRTVLTKHWRLECNHGCQDGPPPPDSTGKWHYLGPMDPIKAILVKNE